MVGIDKDMRKEHVNLSKEWLKTLNTLTGLKLRRRVIKMVGGNPFIEFRVNDWENEEIPNELLLRICDILDIEPLDRNKVRYGNITNKGITLYKLEWVNVMEEYN